MLWYHLAGGLKPQTKIRINKRSNNMILDLEEKWKLWIKQCKYIESKNKNKT